MIAQKLASLEAEIERYKSETARAKRLKEQHARELGEIKKQMGDFERWRDAERAKLEEWKGEQTAKLRKERAELARKLKAAANPAPDRAERAEIEHLKAELTARKASDAERSRRDRAAIDRLRRTNGDLQERVKELQGEVRVYEEERVEWLAKEKKLRALEDVMRSPTVPAAAAAGSPGAGAGGLGAAGGSAYAARGGGAIGRGYDDYGDHGGYGRGYGGADDELARADARSDDDDRDAAADGVVDHAGVDTNYRGGRFGRGEDRAVPNDYGVVEDDLPTTNTTTTATTIATGAADADSGGRWQVDRHYDPDRYNSPSGVARYGADHQQAPSVAQWQRASVDSPSRREGGSAAARGSSGAGPSVTQSMVGLGGLGHSARAWHSSEAGTSDAHGGGMRAGALREAPDYRAPEAAASESASSSSRAPAVSTSATSAPAAPVLSAPTSQATPTATAASGRGSSGDGGGGGGGGGDASDPIVSERTIGEGKYERRYRSGRRVVTFSNGTTKEITADRRSIVRFANGDVKQTYPDTGLVVYYYADARTTHTTYRDGTEVFEFPNGQVERHLPDKTKEIEFPDGTVKVVGVDGEQHSTFPDGTTLIEHANGEQEVFNANGQRVEPT